MKRKIIAVPMGDAAGIGSEIVAKAAAKGILTEYAIPLIVGDKKLLELGMEIADVKFSYDIIHSENEISNINGITLFDTNSLEGDIILGNVSPLNGKEEAETLLKCCDLCKNGLVDGICFAPLNKGAMKAGGYVFESEHQMLAEYFDVKNPYGEINALNGLFTSRATSHIPLKEVSAQITQKTVEDAISLISSTLKRSGITPKLAIAALNPHCGDNGTCGKEELEVIIPTIEKVKKSGIDIDGPFPADVLFLKAFDGKYNAVVTMYHDQGQIAIKLKGFSFGVTIAGGMPYPITTPAHGTAYDIAGKGICSISAFTEAYKLCAAMCNN